MNLNFTGYDTFMGKEEKGGAQGWIPGRREKRDSKVLIRDIKFICIIVYLCFSCFYSLTSSLFCIKKKSQSNKSLLNKKIFKDLTLAISIEILQEKKVNIKYKDLKEKKSAAEVRHVVAVEKKKDEGGGGGQWKRKREMCHVTHSCSQSS